MSKTVPADVYTRDYYLSDCTGYDEFLRSSGRELDVRLRNIAGKLDLKPGQKLLDVGCGRGEIVFHAAGHGVDAIGIDYAKAAVKLAMDARVKQSKDIVKKSTFTVMNAKQLEFEDSSFDWVIMTDVVEHLYPDELRQVYREVYRTLKPGGRLVIHTDPNRIYNDITYPYYCYPLSWLLVQINKLFTGKHYPELPPPARLRTDSHRIMHVNEASYFSLFFGLKQAGFKSEITTKVTILKPLLSWKDRLFNVLVCLDPLSRYFPFNVLFANDFVVVARKS